MSYDSIIDTKYFLLLFLPRDWLCGLFFTFPPDPLSIFFYLLCVLTSVDCTTLAPGRAQAKGGTAVDYKSKIQVFNIQAPSLLDCRLEETVFLHQIHSLCWQYLFYNITAFQFMGNTLSSCSSKLNGNGTLLLLVSVGFSISSFASLNSVHIYGNGSLIKLSLSSYLSVTYLLRGPWVIW